MPTSMKTLLAEVRACKVCAGHLPHGPRPVIQLGASDLSGCSNLTIQNAVFTNTTYGIHADGCNNITVANDTFSQTGAGILANSCQNTTVTSCHFSDMTAGFQQNGGLVGDWAQFAHCTGVNLTNNTATNGPGSNPEDGFNFFDTTGVPGFDQISGNTAGGSNAVGSQSGAILQLEANTSGFTVANNTFGNSPHDVICLTGANNITIENNQLGMTGDGNPSIQLQGGAGTPVVAGNTDSNLPIADAATATPTPVAATPVVRDPGCRDPG
jgi:parallel beta-helix repeat protein